MHDSGACLIPFDGQVEERNLRLLKMYVALGISLN